MCRLLFLLNNDTNHIKNNMLKFLEQSVYTEKSSQKMSDDYGNADHTDGYGFAWLTPVHRWQTYKSILVFHQDPQLQPILNSIKSKVIIGHIRKKTIGNKTIENTHPFFYKNQIFCHNGEILDFSQHKQKLSNIIHPTYLQQIKGTSDSEYLFYLLLTCKKLYVADTKDAKESENTQMNHIFELFFSVIREIGISMLANIIYSTPEYTVLTRYNINVDSEPLSLYYDDSDKELVISSEPITENYKPVKNNSILFVPHSL